MMESLSFLNEFHFIRPHWLWAIIPLLIIVGLIRYIQKQQSGWQSVIAGHLYQHMITTGDNTKARPPLKLLGLAWIIASIALAGPTWERLPQPVYQLNSGKVVLLDMSMSMRATDVKPDRLTRAKYKAIDLVNAITEGETGLVAYAGDAFTISPLSSDAQNLTTLIPSLTPEIMPIVGSEPALGLLAAIELLGNAGYQQGEIFWVTDGVSNQQMKELSEIINHSDFRISILAVGTEDGAPITLIDGELLKDARGAIVIPKLTSNNLRSLTQNGGGRYAPMQSDDSDIDYLVNQLTLNPDADVDEDQDKENFGDKWQETGPYLLILLLPIAAYAFRRGIITVLVATCLLPTYSPTAQADWWQDMWQTADQQALKTYKKGDFEQAANTFNDPLWQGNAHYKNKNYEAAVNAFSQVQDPAKKAEAMYNSGNALAQLGELEKAIAAYEQALAQQPNHQDAAANKKLLEDLKEQQEQQNQDQQDQSDQQDGEQQQNDQQGQQENQNQEGEQQNQDQEQQGQSEQEQSSDSEQQQSEQQDGSEQESQQAEQSEQTEAEQQSSEQEQQSEQLSEQEKEAQAAQAAEQQELTDEQKEQLQRMQNLLNRVPDDPAFLLKRKMQIESQQRKRERLPSNIQENW